MARIARADVGFTEQGQLGMPEVRRAVMHSIIPQNSGTHVPLQIFSCDPYLYIAVIREQQVS